MLYMGKDPAYWASLEQDCINLEAEIKELESQLQQLQGEGWVSVRIERPPHLENIMCFSSDGNYFVANCCRGHLWNLPEDFQNDQVTHWQPLPPPPIQE